MKRHLLIAAAMVLCATVAPRAQQIGISAPEASFRAGWTFTPSFGFAETWDDNISLFDEASGSVESDDIIQAYLPGADLHYEGRHTQFAVGYTGSFLSYQTFSALNRWSQHGRLTFKRQENERMKWFGHATVLSVPSTDFADVGGVPFRRTGAVTTDGRGGVQYALNNRDSIVVGAGFQSIHFEEPVTVDNILHGGRVFDVNGGWRHRLSTRFSMGADYTFRRALVFSSVFPFDLHSVESGADYELSRSWILSGSGGLIYLASNEVAVSKVGPGWRVAIERRGQNRSLLTEYIHAYNPSFGYGGTVRTDEVSFTFMQPISRRFYTTQRAIYRDDAPLTSNLQQLPLRSLRTHSALGWTPQPWVRLEVYYARTQQTNQLEFGQLFRNRIGFQIVTSKPMRMQ